MKKILVTGGAGYIGSHTLVDLIENGFDVISIDNFSRSFVKSLEGVKKITGKEVTNYNIDLCDINALQKVFEEHNNIAGIIHFAAYKSVPESTEKPLLYYYNNLQSLVNVLEMCRLFEIKNFVFSSSCSVYGNPPSLPVTEDTPIQRAECAYAATKQMGEEIVTDIADKHGLRTISLRYFNPVGAHTSAIIGEESPDKPNNLLPIVTQTAAGIMDKMYVCGTDYDTRDGSCIRDYIHVMDIASAHTKALVYLLGDTNDIPFHQVINLGSGNGVSVIEVIQSFEKVTGQKLNYDFGPRRAGDVVAVYADNTKAKEILGWDVRYDTDQMLQTAWEWQKTLLNKS